MTEEKSISISKKYFPRISTIDLEKIQEMRYGENPHQKGAFYRTVTQTNEPCIVNALKLQGKELSYNNIVDANHAIESIKDFEEQTCIIVKHATPCGIASSKNILKAWEDAYETDIYSPFGGIVVFNRKITKRLAQKLSNYFLEVIIAPCFSNRALDIFSKKKKLRLLQLEGLGKEIKRSKLEYRSVEGGFLVQEKDIKKIESSNWKSVTKITPTKKEISSMLFAVKCIKNVKSNSVLFVKGTHTITIGGGQTARVDAAQIAIQKAKEKIKGSIMASDAFFPFRDTVDLAAKSGVKAIIQPGGSIRDQEVIEAANEYDIAMVFSGRRYFKH